MLREDQMVIFQRHGDYERNEVLCDGFLTPGGVRQVKNSAVGTIKFLRRRKIGKIDATVVSRSLRCLQSFVQAWGLMEIHFIIFPGGFDIRLEYYGSPKELRGWREIREKQGDELERSKKAIGPLATYKKFCPELINPRFAVINNAVTKALNSGKRTVFVSNHSPFDQMLCLSLTGKDHPGLKQGEIMILAPGEVITIGFSNL